MPAKYKSKQRKPKKRSNKRKTYKAQYVTGTNVAIPKALRSWTKVAKQAKITTVSAKRELKYWDTGFNNSVQLVAQYPASTPLQLCPLNLLAQGTAENQREDKKIKLHSLELKGFITFASTFGLPIPPQASITLWLYLVQDTQANGEKPQPQEVLFVPNPNNQGSKLPASTTNNYQADDNSNYLGQDIFDLGLAQLNLDNAMRFKILKRKQYDLQPSSGHVNVSGADCFVDSTPQVMLPLDFKINFKRLPIEFSNTKGEMNEIRANNLFWIIGTSSPNLNNENISNPSVYYYNTNQDQSDSVTLTGVQRLRYTDA